MTSFGRQVHRALDMDKVLVLEAGQVKEFDSPARLAADRSFVGAQVNRTVHIDYPD